MSLILLMGIPGSGKSTLRERLQMENPSIVESTSFDDFRKTRSIDNPREARKSFEFHVEEWIQNSKNTIFLIEDVFYLKSMRRPFQKISRRRQMRFGVVYLEVTSSEAIRRNSMREERQTEETILKIFENMEFHEGSMILDPGGVEGIKLEDILKNLEDPGMELKSKPKKTMDSCLPLQNFDVITRRLVSELIQNDLSLDGRRMSEARKHLISKGDFELNSRDLKAKLMDLYYNKF